MIRSRGMRAIVVALGLTAVALPFLVAFDRGERFDGAYAGLLVPLAPLAVALLAYGAPRPPGEGEVEESEVATVVVAGRTLTGTSFPLPRRRRVARVLYRAGWFAFLALLAVVGARDAAQDGPALALVTGVIALLLAPGLVSAVRGLLDPVRTGVFLAPEGVRLGPGDRHFVAWEDFERAAVYPFDFRGFTSYALHLHHRDGRPVRMLEWALPVRAEDLAERLDAARR